MAPMRGADVVGGLPVASCRRSMARRTGLDDALLACRRDEVLARVPALISGRRRRRGGLRGLAAGAGAAPFVGVVRSAKAGFMPWSRPAWPGHGCRRRARGRGRAGSGEFGSGPRRGPAS